MTFHSLGNGITSQVTNSDEVIFFRGMGIPPTRLVYRRYGKSQSFCVVNPLRTGEDDDTNCNGIVFNVGNPIMNLTIWEMVYITQL